MVKGTAVIIQLVLPEESVVALAVAVFERAGMPGCVLIVLAHVTVQVRATPEGLCAD